MKSNKNDSFDFSKEDEDNEEESSEKKDNKENDLKEDEENDTTQNEDEEEYTPKRRVNSKKRKRKSTSKLKDFFDFSFDIRKIIQKHHLISFNAFCNHLIKSLEIKQINDKFLESKEFYLELKKFVDLTLTKRDINNNTKKIILNRIINTVSQIPQQDIEINQHYLTKSQTFIESEWKKFAANLQNSNANTSNNNKKIPNKKIAPIKTSPTKCTAKKTILIKQIPSKKTNTPEKKENKNSTPSKKRNNNEICKETKTFVPHVDDRSLSRKKSKLDEESFSSEVEEEKNLLKENNNNIEDLHQQIFESQMKEISIKQQILQLKLEEQQLISEHLKSKNKTNPKN